jgi:hypothetical protein
MSSAPKWYPLAEVHDHWIVKQARARVERIVSLETSQVVNWAYLEFNSRSSNEYGLRDRSTGKSLVAGHASYSKAMAVLGVDGTTFEAIPNHTENEWLLACKGRELGRLTFAELPDLEPPQGLLSRIARKLIGSSILWQVKLVSGQVGEMQIDYPLGSDRTARRMLRFSDVEMPVHLSSTADYDPQLEVQDFRYPHLWDDDYVLPIGTPPCQENVKLAALLLNVFFRFQYALDFSSS